MAHYRAVLGDLDSQTLQNQGLLGSGSSEGTKRLHRRRVHRSSEEEYKDIPLQVSPGSAAELNAFIDIPATIISHQTLLFVGFAEEKARQIWQQWSNWPTTGPRREIDPPTGSPQVTFLDFITARLGNHEDAWENNDDDWIRCLEACGINSQLKGVIMDPFFKALRLSRSCLFWIHDTIDMRYAGLEDIQSTSAEREANLRQNQDRTRGSGHTQGGGGAGRSSGSRDSISVSGLQGHLRNLSIATVQKEKLVGVSGLWEPDTAAIMNNQPGQLILYKGLDKARLRGMFNHQGEVQIDQIYRLLSQAPTDFNGISARYYFTPDQKIAEHYAAFAKRRTQCQEIVMVCLAIPKNVIEDLEEPQIQHLYWPNPHWKQLVWRSRRGQPVTKPLRKYRDALLIIGSTSTGANRVYEDMNHWEDMTNDVLFRSIDSNLAVQYVFHGEDGAEFFEENGTFKAFGFSDAAAERLLATYT